MDIRISMAWDTDMKDIDLHAFSQKVKNVIMGDINALVRKKNDQEI